MAEHTHTINKTLDKDVTNDQNVNTLLDQMAKALSACVPEAQRENTLIVGIRTGGVWVAEALNQRLQWHDTIGELNISFYRDDFTQIGLHPQVSASSLPFDIEGKHLILVDDVLMSGRTVRAAMNELFDYGRPASIKLAVLIDLDQRQLPIAPTVTGQKMSLNANQRVKLQGPDTLTIDIQTID